MDPELQKIAAAAAAAVVSSMATDGWRRTKGAFVALCGRNRPPVVAELSAKLEADQSRLLDARRTGDEHTEAAVRSYWDRRLLELAEQHPDIRAGLSGLLHHLGLVTPSQAPTFQTYAKDNASVFNVNDVGSMHFGSMP